MGRKETIKPPSQREVRQAAQSLRRGTSIGGRVMAEQRVAIKEGVAKHVKPKS